ncbi:MAG: oligosaccharide flippase family protein [Clostridia bacterium]|nr:oligosaccharide flippase family protein [Clostridia bacterium]
MRKLFKALAILTSFSILTRALGFLFRIILSRAIGAEGLGIYQISFSVFMVLETFISSGLPLVVSKYTSKSIAENNTLKQKSVITSALLIGLITAMLLCIIVILFKNFFGLLFTDKRCLNILIVLLPGLVFSSVYAILRGNLWGQKKYFLVSFTEFLEQLFRMLIFVFLMAIFYSIFDGIVIASISYVISCAMSALIVLIVYLKNKGKFEKPKKDLCVSLLKTSIPITSVRVVSSLLMPIISIIIPIQLIKCGYTNEQALSIFGVAMGMTFPLLYIPSTLVGSLSVTLIPDLSTAIAQENFLEIKTKVNFAIKFGMFVAFLFVPIFYALGETIGIFLYNNIQSGVFLSNSCLLILPICLSGLTVSCLNALNLEVKGFINYAIGALFLFLSIILLTKFIGILSLVWGMGLCLGIASILNIRLLNKKLKYKFFNLMYLTKLFICSIPAILICRWCFNILNIFSPLIISLSISCLAGEIFFLMFGLIFNLYNLSFLKTKKSKKFLNLSHKNG